MARKPGQKIDLELVEQAKALQRAGHKKTWIAKQMDVSYQTVTRWLDRPDESPAMVVARDKEYEKFVQNAWLLLHRFMDMLLAGTVDKDGNLRTDISVKDLTWMMGVLFDKTLGADAKNRHVNPISQSKTLNITYIVEGDGKSKAETVGNPGEVPFIEGEISSDDMRVGSGKDVLRLPGSCDDLPGPAED